MLEFASTAEEYLYPPVRAEESRFRNLLATRNKEGDETSVLFSAETADAANLLSQQQRVMKQTLSQNLKLDVQISVADAHTQQQQQQQQQQQRDNQGRSRQTPLCSG